MYARFSLIMRALIVATAGFAVLLLGLRQASAVERSTPAETHGLQTSGDGEPGIQATERISIPYGFSPALPLMDDGATVTAFGEGACTAGDTITIVFTVTQSTSGESASGVWNGTCTGQRQTWRHVPTATPSPSFVAGMAEACAFAETENDGGISDTQEWCDDVFLAPHWAYLPHVQKP